MLTLCTCAMTSHWMTGQVLNDGVGCTVLGETVADGNVVRLSRNKHGA